MNDLLAKLRKEFSTQTARQIEFELARRHIINDWTFDGTNYGQAVMTEILKIIMSEKGRQL